jgi:hypothetical protein
VTLSTVMVAAMDYTAEIQGFQGRGLTLGNKINGGAW